MIMSEEMCMVCNAKAFEIEIQEDSEEVPELKKGNKYCLDCYGPLQEQFKLTLNSALRAVSSGTCSMIPFWCRESITIPP